MNDANKRTKTSSQNASSTVHIKETMYTTVLFLPTPVAWTRWLVGAHQGRTLPVGARPLALSTAHLKSRFLGAAFFGLPNRPLQPMLSLTNITVHFGQRTLFEHIDVFIGQRERMGLVAETRRGNPARNHSGHQRPSEDQSGCPRGSSGLPAQEMEQRRGDHFEAMSAMAQRLEACGRTLERTDEPHRLRKQVQPHHRELTLPWRIDLLGGASQEEGQQFSRPWVSCEGHGPR